MAYNKAREEKKWLQWKAAEEKELRGLGVREDMIQDIRGADWDAFKAERRFYEHFTEMSTYIDHLAADEAPVPVQSVHDLLNDIDNEQLHNLLVSVDTLTLRIVILKMDGYTSAEIAAKTSLSVSAVNFRIWHLRNKIKNIL